MLASDVAVEISDHSLRLPRGDPSARCGFPFVRDPLCFFPIYFLRASLNTSAIREGKAGKPKFRTVSLSNACHADNDTDNIQ
jgi:hypothetical protein